MMVNAYLNGSDKLSKNCCRCWKKQLVVAKDARRIDVLCKRVHLAYSLLNRTSRFLQLHEIVKEMKDKLETEVGPLDGISAKMARGIVSRLSVACEMQKLISQAIEKADEWLGNLSNANGVCIGYDARLLNCFIGNLGCVGQYSEVLFHFIDR